MGQFSEGGLDLLQMGFKAARVCWTLMQTVADNELIFRSDLHIVARLELTVTHVIFFHPHESSIGIGLTETIPIC
ncbi:hypothetical protein D3C84_1168110 [compost metagenome]